MSVSPGNMYFTTLSRMSVFLSIQIFNSPHCCIGHIPVCPNPVRQKSLTTLLFTASRERYTLLTCRYHQHHNLRDHRNLGGVDARGVIETMFGDTGELSLHQWLCDLGAYHPSNKVPWRSIPEQAVPQQRCINYPIKLPDKFVIPEIYLEFGRVWCNVERLLDQGHPSELVSADRLWCKGLWMLHQRLPNLRMEIISSNMSSRAVEMLFSKNWPRFL